MHGFRAPVFAPFSSVGQVSDPASYPLAACDDAFANLAGPVEVSALADFAFCYKGVYLFAGAEEAWVFEFVISAVLAFGLGGRGCRAGCCRTVSFWRFVAAELVNPPAFLAGTLPEAVGV